MTSRPSPHSLHDTVCFQTVLNSSDLHHTQYFYFFYALFPLDIGFIRWFSASFFEQKSRRASKHTLNSIIGNIYPTETCHRDFLRYIPCAGGHQLLTDGTWWSTEKTGDGVAVPTSSTTTQSTSELRGCDQY